MDAAFEFVNNVVDAGQVQSFPTRSSEVNTLMEQGEIWLATQYGEGAFQFEAQGGPVASVIPQEGTMVFIVGCAVVKDAPNSEMAHSSLI